MINLSRELQWQVKYMNQVSIYGVQVALLINLIVDVPVSETYFIIYHGRDMVSSDTGAVKSDY